MQTKSITVGDHVYEARVGNLIDGGVRTLLQHAARERINEKLLEHNVATIADLSIRLQAEYLVHSIYVPAFVAAVTVDGQDMAAEYVLSLPDNECYSIAEVVMALNPGWFPVSEEARGKDPDAPFGETSNGDGVEQSTEQS